VWDRRREREIHGKTRNAACQDGCITIQRVVKWQQAWQRWRDNLFARPQSGWLVNCWLEMSDSMWVVNQCSIDQLLVVLLVEELTTDHQPHTGDHVVLNQPSHWWAVLRHQILVVSTCYNRRANPHTLNSNSMTCKPCGVKLCSYHLIWHNSVIRFEISTTHSFLPLAFAPRIWYFQ